MNGLGRFTEIISLFSPNTGKYGPEKIVGLDTFHTVLFIIYFHSPAFKDCFTKCLLRLPYSTFLYY